MEKTVISSPGNKGEGGSILLDCIIVMLLLSIGYLGIVKTFTVSARSVMAQGSRFEHYYDGKENRQIFFARETTGE
jgi:hypothetical protein